jgi:molecular chaperone GrpE
MSNRLIFQALSDLARRVEALNHARTGDETSGETDSVELDKQVKRLARESFKMNTLVEAQSEQTQQALQTAQAALDDLRQSQTDAIRQARLDLIKALLPVLDGIEAGLRSGAAQIKALLPTSPDAARALASWLKGQQLLRERLLKLLESEGVTPIPAVGQSFDPYQHVAVKAVNDPTKKTGVIVAEERRGYRYGDTVLRYADVIVNQSSEK